MYVDAQNKCYFNEIKANQKYERKINNFKSIFFTQARHGRPDVTKSGTSALIASQR